MSKIRINDLARELEVKSKAILDVLQQVGVTEKKTHSSSLELDEAERVRKHFSGHGTASTKDERHSRAAGDEIKTKIDLSKISKPGDVLAAIRGKTEAAATPPPAKPVTAAPTVPKPVAKPAPPTPAAAKPAAPEPPKVAATTPPAPPAPAPKVVAPQPRPEVKPPAAAPAPPAPAALPVRPPAASTEAATAPTEAPTAQQTPAVVQEKTTRP